MLSAFRKGEKLVYSTRWFDEDADHSECEASLGDGPSPTPGAPRSAVAVQIVIHNEERDERLAALSQRPTLFDFLKNDVRSHAGAAL